jgi:hypothetical protein
VLFERFGDALEILKVEVHQFTIPSGFTV